MAVKKSIDKRLLEFVKEWGGVATVLIAVLYTFPFDAAGRYLRWQEQSLIEARQTLAETSALYADEVSTSEKLTDPRLKEFLINTYNIRIYNKLYALGSFFALSGFQKEGVGYTNRRSTKPGRTTTGLRSIGSSAAPFGGRETRKTSRARATPISRR